MDNFEIKLTFFGDILNFLNVRAEQNITPSAGLNSLDGSAEPPTKRHLLLLRRPQPSPSLGRRVTSEVGGDGESGEEGVGETMPQVYDTHYFSLAHLFGFKARSDSTDMSKIVVEGWVA